MAGRPDPKPGPRAKRTPRGRIVDPAAVKLAALADPTCVACRTRPTSNGAHVVARGDGGDDLAENIVGLCGSGTSGCHGAYHGSPYVADGIRWTAEDVGARIGVALLARPRTIEYVLRRLGDVAGRHYLQSRYHLTIEETG